MLGDSLGISNRGTEAKSITSCDNAFVTNILSLPLRYTTLTHRNHLLPQAAHRTPPGSFALCESEAAATNVLYSESKAAATKRPAITEITPLTLPKSVFFYYQSKEKTVKRGKFFSQFTLHLRFERSLLFLFVETVNSHLLCYVYPVDAKLYYVHHLVHEKPALLLLIF